MALRSILIADDEEPIRHVLTVLLAEQGYFVRSVKDGEDALRELAARDYDALVTDVRMPGMDGLSLVRAVQEQAPETTVIVMSAYGSHDLALEAMKAGAYDYLGKPFRPDEVLLVLRKAEERERLRAENRRLRREIEASRGAGAIVAESAAMKEVLRTAQKVAPAKTTVLISGESGTGKELIARALHEMSPRAERPFVAVNCGAIPEQLIESELFGHAKGAFTGADAAKRGLFEEADGGTLLLDATHQDLAQAVAAGTFREDLFYRLNVVGLRLPPLRERPEEIEALARRFLARHASRLGLAEKPLSAEALRLLLAWRWPGNVRELENALERALVLSEGEEIGPEALPDELRSAGPPAGPPPAPAEGDLSVKKAQRDLEDQVIRDRRVRFPTSTTTATTTATPKGMSRAERVEHLSEAQAEFLDAGGLRRVEQTECGRQIHRCDRLVE